MPPLLELAGLSRVYKTKAGEVRALDGLDLSIERGEFVAVMGPSGSGKSTLLQILGLLDRPTRGRYRLDGREASSLNEEEQAAWRAEKIGFVFQFFNLLPRATALANVELPLIYGRKADRSVRARAALEAVGLADRADFTPDQLSGGQQQRVAIARAVAGDPLLLLADEPTGNLSSEQGLEIMAHLKAMNERGITVVLITHESEVAAYARRRIVMRDGRLVSDSGGSGNLSQAPPAPAAAAGPSLAARLEENLDMALESLAANPLRTGLAALGIVIGVASLIAMMALGAGAREATRQKIAAMGANLLHVYPQVGSRRIFDASREGFTRLTLEDVAALSELKDRGVPIVRAAPVVAARVRAVSGERNWDTQLSGVWPAYVEMHDAKPVWGRFFTAQEDIARSRVAVLGRTVAQKLFSEGEDPVGRTIRLQGDYFRVIGVLKPRGGSSWRDQDDEILAPLQTVARRLLGTGYVHRIEVEIERPEVSSAVSERILETLRRRRGLPPEREDEIRVFDMAEVQSAMTATTRIITTLLGAMAAIALAVGGIGIMNIMLVSVKERTREIGLRKAMGARPRDILLQFLIESAAIAASGGAAGILVGMAAGWVMARFAGWPILTSPWAVWTGFLFSTLTGVAFGLWPARDAARLPAAEALRYE